MADRLHKALRLLAVQKQLDQLSKSRLVELLSQSASLDERYLSLMRFLDQESAFNGLFSIAMMRKLKTLDEMRAQTAIDVEVLRTAHICDRRCLRHVDRLVLALQSDENRIVVGRDLEDAAGLLDQRRPQGSRKLLGPPY
jgi:hypothetical protein